jgi:RNA polymerase sigma-70 factor (ECF subfamily)
MEPLVPAGRLATVDLVEAVPITAEAGPEPTVESVTADVELVAAELDTPAFTDFYRGHRDRVVRALALTLGDVDLATDAADEAMARAYQRWEQVGGLANRPGWVYRVGLNWATSALRRRRRAHRPLFEPEAAAIGSIPEPDIMRALAELEVRQRAVVVCRYLLGWSERETADALATPVGTVKSRLHRATRHLADRLAHLRPEEH